MKKRAIILLVFTLVVISCGFFFVKTTAHKQIAGAFSGDLPIDRNALILPPEKSESFELPRINSKAAILIDAQSAYPLYAKNADLKVPIASTTKIMTASVVLNDFSDRLEEVVTVTAPMVNVEGSDIQLRVGEKIKVKDLLKGLLIMSGNDTAYALALHFGGKEDFVKRMNDKAAFLGLSSTHYRCPAGLDDEGYSTAKDLAMLTNYALKNKKFAEIVNTPAATISSVDGRIIHDLKNSNRLLQNQEANFYPFAIGVKTGFTYAAGHCLVSSAVKDGHQLIGVILNTNENTITASATESKKLLDWGYYNWAWN